MPFQTTQTLIRTVTTDSYCYVTKNYGPAGNNPVKNILGGAPLVGSILGQKKQTTQCGKARAIETSSVRGLDAADKLLISPSAASSAVGDFRALFAFRNRAQPHIFQSQNQFFTETKQPTKHTDNATYQSD